MNRKWQRFLHVPDEDALARLVIHFGHDTLGYRRVAALWQQSDGSLALHGEIGYASGHSRLLREYRIDPEELRDAFGEESVNVVPPAGGHPVLQAFGASRAIVLTDRNQRSIGLILLGDPTAEAELPDDTLDMFGYAASMALLLLRQKQDEEERIRMIQTQKHQLEALLHASANVHGPNLDEVLERIAASMTKDGGFRRAAVYLRDDADFLHARAFVGVSPEDAERIRVPLPFATFSHLMRPEMQISRSFLFDHRKHELPPELLSSLSIPEGAPAAPDLWHPLDSLTIPLQDRGGRTIGVVSMDEPDDGRYPGLERIQVLELFAGACAVAVEQARLYDEVQRLAATDPLTGLQNRRAFEDALHRAWAQSARAAREFCLLYCDLDGLKHLNDALGHEAGDLILQAVAVSLRSRLRDGDLAARIGGDEFVILLPDTDADGAAVVAEDVRGAVASLQLPAIPPEIELSLSVGVAGSCAAGSPGDLVQQADKALYAAKGEGRNRVRVA
ncbi:MAG TPA: sensor domain-containing diguanylate cyclase [Chloroflexota bacterium]|nr:sensor domain-containing diguanylate cyclase [Chloroflexota bacterium]